MCFRAEKYLNSRTDRWFRCTKPDPEKIAAVQHMKSPETKREVRQVMGFFSCFRDFMPTFAELAKLITDLTSKRVFNKILWVKNRSRPLKL